MTDYGYSIEENIYQVFAFAQRESFKLDSIILSDSHFEQLKKDMGHRITELPNGNFLITSVYGEIEIKKK